MNNILKGKRLLLRALEPEDLNLLYRWENDTSIWEISETLSPVSRFILKKYLANSHKDIYETRQLRMMIQLQEENRPIGTIDLFDFDHFHQRAAVGILIAESEERRKGYALEALELLLSYCSRILKLHQLYCTISVDNQSSLELFQKAGFKITGTRLKWNYRDDGFADEHFLQIFFPSN